MKNKSQWMGLDLVELEEEVTIRLKLHDEMVGTLYPGILRDEIAQLRTIIAEKRGIIWHIKT
jgi:hypothetical protein